MFTYRYNETIGHYNRGDMTHGYPRNRRHRYVLIKVVFLYFIHTEHIMPISLSFIASTKYLYPCIEQKYLSECISQPESHIQTIANTMILCDSGAFSLNVHLVSSALKRKFSIKTCKFRENVRWSITILAQPKITFTYNKRCTNSMSLYIWDLFLFFSFYLKLCSISFSEIQAERCN